MKIYIVEDDKTAGQQLENLVQIGLKESNIIAEVKYYANGVTFLQDYTDGGDIVFLDCDMPLMDGIEVARRIRKKDKKIIIIFVTNLMQYAVDGYEVSAFDYILKPLVAPVFLRKFKRAIQKIESEKEGFLAFKSKRSMVTVAASDIVYLEVNGHYITVHTLTDEFISRCTLSELEDIAGEYGIIRCASCYMINLLYVKQVKSNQIILADETEIALTRSYKKEFMQKLASYLNK